MSGFAEDWLSAREPVDRRARSTEVQERFIAFLAQQDPGTSPTVLDLGSGTGSTFRALAPHLPTAHRWRFAEHDPALIAAARKMLQPADPPVEIIEADLSAGVPERLLDGVDGVTTSAFLDLVSAGWVEALAAALAHRRLPFLAMLTYDGRMDIDPQDPLDARVRDAVNAHQRGDKGFGPALGPDAATHARRTFCDAGYLVQEQRSDWVARPDEIPFQTLLIEGWAQAAREMGVAHDDLAAWHARRQRQIAAGALLTRVGHRDLVALPG